ncbi:MAG: hypothetical protein B7Z55_04515 [Planctomycetales bacterium 12-60-4]|nr:MAG: hypothetical protein B7Z55_04515 [Planctomycetales bacterium 12-60-4]
MNRRHFLTATVASSAVAAAAAPLSGIIDCQSHLFFPEVIKLPAADEQKILSGNARQLFGLV